MLRPRTLTILLTLALASPSILATTVSEKVFRKLTEIHELRDTNKTEQALRATDQLLNSRIKEHERAQGLLLKADILLQLERYKDAIAPMETALASGHVNQARVRQVRYNLAQLYSQTERYRDAIRILESWLRDEQSPPANAYFMLAFAHLELNSIRNARRYADLGREAADKLTQGQYQFLGGIYLQQSDWSALQELLEEAIMQFPQNGPFWKQLAQVHLERNREARALAVMRMAYTKGLLQRDEELVMLAQLMRLQEIPWLAAQVLEDGIKRKQVKENARNWKLLGNSWVAAREFDRAYSPLTRAAELDKKPRDWLRLGRLYAQNAKWKRCEESARSGLRHNPRDSGPYYLLEGICAYEQGKTDMALNALTAAKKSKKSASEATGWIQFIKEL